MNGYHPQLVPKINLFVRLCIRPIRRSIDIWPRHMMPSNIGNACEGMWIIATPTEHISQNQTCSQPFHMKQPPRFQFYNLWDGTNRRRQPLIQSFHRMHGFYFNSVDSCSSSLSEALTRQFEFGYKMDVRRSQSKWVSKHTVFNSDGKSFKQNISLPYKFTALSFMKS